MCDVVIWFRNEEDYEEMDLTEYDEDTVIDMFEEVGRHFTWMLVSVTKLSVMVFMIQSNSL